MQIVIDIPTEDYEKMKWTSVKNGAKNELDYMRSLILNGTPLPKGHGRLIDADALTARMEQRIEEFSYNEIVSESNNVIAALAVFAPTVIEAEVENDT